MPPPAPQASLSLFPRNRNRYRPASRPATPGRFIGPRSPETADGATTAANRSRPPWGRESQESHGNVPICYDHQLLEELPRRGRGYLRPPICPATFHKVSFAPLRERRQKYRGARTEVIGKISDTANSAVVFSARYARGDRLELPGWLCPRSALRETRFRSY